MPRIELGPPLPQRAMPPLHYTQFRRYLRRHGLRALHVFLCLSSCENVQTQSETRDSNPVRLHPEEPCLPLHQIPKRQFHVGRWKLPNNQSGRGDSNSTTPASKAAMFTLTPHPVTAGYLRLPRDPISHLSPVSRDGRPCKCPPTPSERPVEGFCSPDGYSD